MNDANTAGAALTATHHLACIGGPDIGVVIAVGQSLGRGGATPLTDPMISRAHAATRSSRDCRRIDVEDLASGNGTFVRRRLRPWRRCRPHSRVRLGVGDRIRIGRDVFEARARPATPVWPAAGTPSAPRRRLGALLPFTIMLSFAMWRLSTLIGDLRVLLAVLGAGALVGAVAVAWRLLLRRRRRERIDAGFLSLVVASRVGVAPAALDAGPELVVWPRPPIKCRRPLIIDPMPRGKKDEDACSRPGFVGPDANASARWLAVQIASVLCGADVTLDDGSRWSLCGGGAPIHIQSHGLCSACGPKGLSEDVIHIGTAADAGTAPAWCDRLIPVADAPACALWWSQIAQRLPSDAALPEALVWEEVAAANEDAEPVPGSSPLAVPVGVGADGPRVLDLVAEGPHALVTGGTGSGKSEALATWLLAMCERCSPDDLRLVLIDYKGGATFSPFADLPHTDAVLTDLHPEDTARALLGIEALLIDRERSLARLGLPDVTAWRALSSDDAPAAPPRILIVIDEFKVLADSHPEALDGLLRLAAQGRSLGLHLIAATQRPSGAVTSSMRANMDLRIALRCLSAADSMEVLGSDAAASLPRIPGRAIISEGGPVQFALVHDKNAARTRIRSKYERSLPFEPLWPPPPSEELRWDDLDAIPSGSTKEAPVIGLIDGISVGGNRPLVWPGGGVLVEASARDAAISASWVRGIAERIALAQGLPLHHHSSAPSPLAVSQIPPDDQACLCRLLEFLPDHGASVLAIDDLDAALDGLAARIGDARRSRLWREFLERSAGDVVLVCATPGAFGSTAPRRASIGMRIIRADRDEDLWRSGVHARTLAPRRANDALVVTDGAEPRVAAIPLRSDSSLALSSGRLPNAASWHVVSRPESLPSDEGPRLFVGDDWSPYHPDDDVGWLVICDDPDRAAPWLAAAAPSSRGAPPGGVEFLPSSAWHRVEREATRVVLAPDPTPDVVRALMQHARRAPVCLLAERWNECRGILVDRGRADRVLLAQGRPAGS